MKVNPVAKKLAPFPEAKHDENACVAHTRSCSNSFAENCRHSENQPTP